MHNRTNITQTGQFTHKEKSLNTFNKKKMFLLVLHNIFSAKMYTRGQKLLLGRPQFTDPCFRFFLSIVTLKQRTAAFKRRSVNTCGPHYTGTSVLRAAIVYENSSI